MLKIYSWPTPNGHKVHIMLEECGLRLGRDWEAIPVDIGAGDQFKADFLKISPNNKIPAMIDPYGPDGKPISLFESGAMLLYLASKTGKLLPKTDRLKFQVLQWLMFQVGGVGPMLGQTHHFRKYAPEKIAYAINRYTKESKRLYGVMDRQLATSKFMACNQYTIADVAIFPWLRSWEDQGIDWVDYPNLKKWFDVVSARPAVQRGVNVMADRRRTITGEKEREILFGNTQYQKR
ncbi:glutathione binding-like protein [Polaromonas sp.]|uniref:glutathione binding-like protein n=1 Tax=Polaromonas sp. TaxID=1869339 RepID=UPI0017ECC10E|nr:glutathione binding-like protein [Polaromonas sp.]NML87173.1 glutathione S-transferase family protein [Polaromonas sp.]